MLRQEVSDDYVVAINETHTVREFVEIAFGKVGITVGRDVAVVKVVVKNEQGIFRPAEVVILLGGPVKAESRFGWKWKILFDELVGRMEDTDMELVRREIAFVGSSEQEQDMGTKEQEFCREFLFL